MADIEYELFEQNKRTESEWKVQYLCSVSFFYERFPTGCYDTKIGTCCTHTDIISSVVIIAGRKAHVALSVCRIYK